MLSSVSNASYADVLLAKRTSAYARGRPAPRDLHSRSQSPPFFWSRGGKGTNRTSSSGDENA